MYGKLFAVKICDHYKILLNPHRIISIEGFSSTGASSLGASHRMKPYVLGPGALAFFIF